MAVQGLATPWQSQWVKWHKHKHMFLPKLRITRRRSSSACESTAPKLKPSSWSDVSEARGIGSSCSHMDTPFWTSTGQCPKERSKDRVRRHFEKVVECADTPHFRCAAGLVAVLAHTSEVKVRAGNGVGFRWCKSRKDFAYTTPWVIPCVDSAALHGQTSGCRSSLSLDCKDRTV